MHLTPENAPIGAKVLVQFVATNGSPQMAFVVDWSEMGWLYLRFAIGGYEWISSGQIARGEWRFIRRLDQPAPAKPSPDRLDALPTVDDVTSGRVAGEWDWECGRLSPREKAGRFEARNGEVHYIASWGFRYQPYSFLPGKQHFTRAQPTLTTTPGDSVTIERDRAAMDAMRRLAAKAMGISVVSDDVNVESLEAVVQARLGCIERELSALRDFRRASERLLGEGDAVEWKPLPADFGQGNTTGSPGYSRGFGWCMLSDGARVSEFFQPPHPNLHPVRVDGVWRWTRKDKA